MNNPIICELHGDTRIFATINTSEYNGDGKYSVQVTDYKNVESMGWKRGQLYDNKDNKSRMIMIEDMCVGEIIVAEEIGAYLMRLA